jgi:rhodanese-related sulfurtransferase
MRTLFALAALFFALATAQTSHAEGLLSPADAAKLVAEGNAILIDVREPSEWAGGVVEGALLLPLSDLRGDREKWGPVLNTHRDKTLVLYCRSGTRAGLAARILAGEGREVRNAGAFSTWKEAGQPLVVPR